MPSNESVVCIQCDKIESGRSHTLECGKVCGDCYDLLNNLKTETDEGSAEQTTKSGETETAKATRKSTRSTRYKSKGNSGMRNIPKGKGRKYIFKTKPLKAPTEVATVSTVDSLYYRGSYMQIGDIVAMLDVDGDIYFAQIRGLLIDQYCEKSATITWLLPTQSSPPSDDRFDPATYIIGPEEDLPRRLSCMQFVMHAPSDYYYTKSPYPIPDSESVDNTQKTNFVWSSLKPVRYAY